MDVSDLKELFGEVNKRMTTAIEHVRHELSGVRTGRASVTILDSVFGIITPADLQKAPVRMWLFGIMTLIEVREDI